MRNSFRGSPQNATSYPTPSLPCESTKKSFPIRTNDNKQISLLNQQKAVETAKMFSKHEQKYENHKTKETQMKQRIRKLKTRPSSTLI